MKELYVAVYHHEYGVDSWVFHFEPEGRQKYPSPRKVAEHFKINFEGFCIKRGLLEPGLRSVVP